jgi:orotidine-5'-phosphate decarboxylase
MRNPSTTTLEIARTMRAEGVAWSKVLEETGLNYSQAWLYVERTNLPADLDLEAAFQADPKATVAAARAEGNSWGLIAVRCNVPESQVRKQFKNGSGLLSQGLRIGKGGRFFLGEPELYVAELNKPGTAIAAESDLPLRTRAITASRSQRMIHLDMKELKALAADYGIDTSKMNRKAQLVKAIISAS